MGQGPANFPARVGCEVPYRDDERFSNVEFEVGGNGDSMEGFDQRGKGFPEIGNDECCIIGVSGQFVAIGENG